MRSVGSDNESVEAKCSLQSPNALGVAAREAAMREPRFLTRGSSRMHQRNLMAMKEIIEIHDLLRLCKREHSVSQPPAPT